MNDYIISMFIDDELGLDDKVEFVEKVHASSTFKDETVSLLNQEKMLRADPVEHAPHLSMPLPSRPRARVFSPVYLATAALAVTVVILAFTLLVQIETSPVSHRFVIYQPDVSRAQIAGSFTDWQRLSMREIGSSGYWELTLDLSRGEHRFSYFLEGVEGEKRLADPTVLTRESDDFGGENSILYLGEQT